MWFPAVDALEERASVRVVVGRCPIARAVLVQDLTVDDRARCGGIDVGAASAGCTTTGSAALVADDPALEAVVACLGECLDLVLVGDRCEGLFIVVRLARRSKPYGPDELGVTCRLAGADGDAVESLLATDVLAPAGRVVAAQDDFPMDQQLRVIAAAKPNELLKGVCVLRLDPSPFSWPSAAGSPTRR